MVSMITVGLTRPPLTRNATIGPNQIAFDAEVAAIERACRAPRSRPKTYNSILGLRYEYPYRNCVSIIPHSPSNCPKESVASGHPVRAAEAVASIG
jgi:hypothetical protein